MKNLLSASDLSKPQIIEVLDLAHEMSDVNEREIRKLPTLRGKTVVNLFFEDSTRTRISFELAAKRLSADVINFAAKGSSVSKGESLKDTAQTLEAMGADAIVLRHGSSGSAYRLAHSGWVRSAVINAGDGSHEHPTQALLDAMTIRQALVTNPIGSDLSGKKVLIVGDISHSRVARSNLILLKALGATLATCGPATLVPRSLEPTGGIFYSLDKAIDEFAPDAVLMLRIQSERMEASFFPTEREYSRVWGMNSERLSRLGDSAIVLHPGPMNRGLEIDAASADSPKSKILDQVQNGVAVRMAVLFHLLAGEKRETR
ncbi:MAG: aspartate carbamoyltransferase catalytic subunit [Actinobacteria bacterium]|uniref:aspartate carbamoyltransferase n=1 Tax=freshwater metagenome TaxID=449393 RepID=A0A6J7DG95_9ZZZZ|nr:aspartate carbamoyltransferase catalytic subunit [Actinomycetota bacterium]